MTQPPIDKLDQSAAYLRGALPALPSVVLVLGSGLGDYAKDRQIIAIPYGDIPHFPASTVAGHAGELALCEIAGKYVAVMRGRWHTYEGYAPGEAVFALQVMRRLGARYLILTNAAGAVNKTYAPGDLVMIADHINLFHATPLSGPNNEEIGPRFQDMTDAYSSRLRQQVIEMQAAKDIFLREGVYMFFPGPQFETPAEIRAARVLGADLVGMSTVPEAICAAHCGLKTIAVSCVTNMAAGIAGTLSHVEVTETGQQVAGKFSALVDDIVALMD
ncbi:MAG: purine-nucleoside phosphorylase [Christensenellales bacterium]|jgi:purine-nucleoside phosphorylase